MHPDKIISHLVAMRKQRGISLREVARMAGMAPASLSAIEKGSSSPTLATLHKLLQALGTDFASCVAGMDSVAESPVFPGASMKTLTDHSRAYTLLFPARADVKMQMVHERLLVSASQAEWETHQCDMGALLLEGGPLKLEIQGTGEWVVRPGDAFYIREGQPHRAHNTGRRDARLLSVMVPPRY